MPKSGERSVAPIPSSSLSPLSPLSEDGQRRSAIEREDGPEAATGHAIAPRPLRVLIVEDEAPLGRATVRVLARDGHEAVAVESAEAALHALGGCDSRRTFDVVISDVGLPGMSGWQLASLMRETYPDIAVVITSGWIASLPDDAVSRLGISPDHFVAKPYSREDLRRVLESVASPRGRKRAGR